jgi:hypothetical protein
VLVAVSALGFYGERGDEELDERSEPGTGFLATLCRDWEAAADPAAARGVRVVHPRFGLVLTPQGGVLARLLPWFRLGLGGPLGDGRAWWSWIALDDAIAVLERSLEDARLSGPLNATAPGAVTSAAFARTLGHVLRRPARLAVPAFALRALFGEMADGALLLSQRAVPRRLASLGHVFRHPDLEGALRHLLASGPEARVD